MNGATNEPRPTETDVRNTTTGATADSITQFGVVHGDVTIGGHQGTATPVLRTLPRDQPLFTGRTTELENVRALIADDDMLPVVVIDGMAGIGKSAFAVRAAHMLASEFPDGLLFVPLHGHTPGLERVQPIDALDALLAGAGVAPDRIPESLDARAAMWRDRTADSHLLLVLDDAANAGQIEPLLPASPRSLVLVTTRLRLSDMPDAHVVSLTPLDETPASTLFLRMTGRREMRTEDPGVVDLVTMCGGLPLAISLVAGQMKHHPLWTPVTVADDLARSADRLGSLGGENRSVETAFRLSYGRLWADRQLLFRRLGLHPGDEFDAYAAAALHDTDVATASEILNALYTHHLINESGPGRYQFHDLLRSHARTLVAADPREGRAAATDRLLAYYLKSARAADRQLSNRTAVHHDIPDEPAIEIPDLPDFDRASRWMEQERFNLQAAVDLASRTEQPRHAFAITLAMSGFFLSEGYWSHAIQFYQQANEVSHANDDRLSVAGMHCDTARIGLLTDGAEPALHLADEAVRIYADLDERLGLAHALSVRGSLRHRTGDYPGAFDDLTAAIDRYREIDDCRGESEALRELGTTWLDHGDLDHAENFLARALELARTAGDRTAEADALISLARVHYRQKTESADTELRRGMTLYRELLLDNHIGPTTMLIVSRHIQRLADDLAEVLEPVIEALHRFRDAEIACLGAADPRLDILRNVVNEMDQTRTDLNDLPQAFHAARDSLSRWLSMRKRDTTKEEAEKVAAQIFLLPDILAVMWEAATRGPFGELPIEP